MNRQYILLAILAVVLIVVALALTFVVYRQKANTSGQNSVSNSNTENPFGSATVPNSTATSSSSVGPASGPIIPITLKDNSTVVVPNFTAKNQPAQASATNGYQLAGSDDSTFHVLFFPSGSYFLITLLAEPLGQTRLAAEAGLRSELGLSDSQLCNLNIQVFTPGFVNESYAGQNLGLSFCSGSVALPQ